MFSQHLQGPYAPQRPSRYSFGPKANEVRQGNGVDDVHHLCPKHEQSLPQVGDSASKRLGSSCETWKGFDICPVEDFELDQPIPGKDKLCKREVPNVGSVLDINDRNILEISEKVLKSS